MVEALKASPFCGKTDFGLEGSQLHALQACNLYAAYINKLMPSQNAIARRLGVTQATVSMALRNHPRVSPEMRERVREVARELGYRPNPYVTSLMKTIREGRSPQDYGCIAILVDETSVEAWLGWHRETYSANYEGYRKEANQHGYHVECFCLRARDTSPELVDRRLRARGIQGLILAAPRLSHKWPELNIRWENYASVAVSHTWRYPAVNRVSTYHTQSMVKSYDALLRRGCRRIGFCQPTLSQIHEIPSLWMAGYLMSQWEFSDLPKLEPFVGTVHDTSDEDFRRWFKRWKPDALITAIGDEAPRLQSMGISGHRQDGKGVQITCLNRPQNSPFPGIDESHEILGRKACEVVINQLVHNQHGFPEHPTEVLVPGTWIDEPSVGRSLPLRPLSRERIQRRSAASSEPGR